MEIGRTTFAAIMLIVLLTLPSWFYGYIQGQNKITAKWEAEKKQQLEDTLQNLNLGLNTSYKLGLQYEQEREEVRYVTRTLVKEVPKYIKDTSSCPKLPDGWGVLHDFGANP
ncbi:hypothetical protein [Oligella urethralis]|uniref:hypothetical protein n=1 Tax=Oligella urethralis TaxID=90245 RepID=UPI000660004F|nr:hypothetical protein [Oligella urethralis]